MSSLHLGLCPGTTGKVKNMPSSSPGNHQLCLRQSEILMVSSQNWVLPQQDKTRPHSAAPSPSPSIPFCNLRAYRPGQKLEAWDNGIGHSQNKSFKPQAHITPVPILKNLAWHQ